MVPENGDFHLTWANFPIPDSTKSPCIDTGDPNSPLDPDSTRTDMGAYYFDQGIHANFIANPTLGYLPLEVNFIDQSAGNIINWQWDFQNDGIIDSYEQNSTFIYNDAGIYDVKLKVNDSTQVDSLIKHNYITVEYVPPAPPTGVQINIIGNDAVITWNPVDTTIYGTPIIVDYYLVLFCETPDSVFYYLASTTDTTYTHVRVAMFRDKMFYKIESFVGTKQELDESIKKYFLKRED